MSAPLILRVLSASVAAANRAGNIIREIMSTGKLGVVDKVSLKHITDIIDRSVASLNLANKFKFCTNCVGFRNSHL